jgi:hypothetical protein
MGEYLQLVEKTVKDMKEAAGQDPSEIISKTMGIEKERESKVLPGEKKPRLTDDGRIPHNLARGQSPKASAKQTSGGNLDIQSRLLKK